MPNMAAMPHDPARAAAPVAIAAVMFFIFRSLSFCSPVTESANSYAFQGRGPSITVAVARRELGDEITDVTIGVALTAQTYPAAPT